MLGKSDQLSLVVSGDLAIYLERSGLIAGFPRACWVPNAYAKACTSTHGGKVPSLKTVYTKMSKPL